ncbi:hypothetical protein GQ600_6120 [Phytophthora cactorum]|nr:hypothetical protein GQ600_6120 [Phytophthora cactorum]
MERAASAASDPEADDAPTPVQNPHAHVPPTAEAHSPEDHVPSSTLKTYFVQPMQKRNSASYCSQPPLDQLTYANHPSNCRVEDVDVLDFVEELQAAGFPGGDDVDATRNTNDARYKLFSFMIHDVFGHHLTRSEAEYDTARKYMYSIVEGKQITLEQEPESKHAFLKYFDANWHQCRRMWSGFGRSDVPHLTLLITGWSCVRPSKDVLKSTMTLDEVRDSSLNSSHHGVLYRTSKLRTVYDVRCRIADIMSRNGTPVYLNMLEALSIFEDVVKDGEIPPMAPAAMLRTE